MEIYVLPLGMLQTNTYIVYDQDTKEAFVVDPATKAELIADFIVSNNLKLQAILITHGHFDHIGAVCDLKIAFPDATIYMHQNDIAKLDNTQVSRTLGMSIKTKPFVVDKIVNDGDEIVVAGNTIKVMHTPGHSSGSVCYIMGDVIFSGDTLFKDSYGRVQFADGSIEDIKQSIQNLFNLDGDYKVLCGHGEGTQLRAEATTNPILKIV